MKKSLIFSIYSYLTMMLIVMDIGVLDSIYFWIFFTIPVSSIIGMVIATKDPRKLQRNIGIWTNGLALTFSVIGVILLMNVFNGLS